MSTIIFGRNAVRATLEEDRVQTLFAATRFQNDEFVTLARKHNVSVKFVSDDELTKMARVPSHQGFVAICDDYGTSFFERAHRKRQEEAVSAFGDAGRNRGPP